ncbi:MAG: energy transducer TonB [Geobacter sp.]|nr:energy transducer TonB [Geobacter sp.]
MAGRGNGENREGGRGSVALPLAASLLGHLVLLATFVAIVDREEPELHKNKVIMVDCVPGVGRSGKLHESPGGGRYSAKPASASPSAPVPQQDAPPPPTPTPSPASRAVNAGEAERLPAMAATVSPVVPRGGGGSTGNITAAVTPPGSGSGTAGSGAPSFRPGQGAGRGATGLDDYQAHLKKLIKARKEYPLMARRRMIEGCCLLRFTLRRSGDLKSVSILRSSGNGFLDEAAARAVTSVGSFPPFPSEFSGEEGAFTVSLSFTLRR